MAKSNGSKKSKSSSKNSKKSSDNSKNSPKSQKSSKSAEPMEEPEIIVPVPDGIMHKRMRFILESTLKTDVEFIVGLEGGETSIKAHKCMLSAESPMFEKLFADCQEWKDAQLKKQEQEALEIRQREAEVEMELAKKAEARNIEDTSDRSRPKSKGEERKKKGSKDGSSSSKRDGSKEGKTKGSKDKDGSASSKRDGSNRSKSPKSKEKSEKSGSKSAGKDSNSKDSKSSKSKGSKKSGKESADRQGVISIAFSPDEVIGPDQIRVQDVNPRGFFQLLRYIYYDDMTFKGVIATIHTLYAARKYCFYDLARACVNYLENNVCVEHIFSLLQTAINFHEDRLLNLSMRLIINNTTEVINRDEFKYVKKEIVVMILEQDVLNVQEIELFDRVMKWAALECDRIKIPSVSMNQRFALGNHNFALIRFPAMDGKEFANQVVDHGALRTDEIIPILKYFITGEKPNLPYSCQPRRRPCLEIEPLDTASLASSEVSFIGEMEWLRSDSFGNLVIQNEVPPPEKCGLLKVLKRSCSPPPRFKVHEDEFEKIRVNLIQLKRLYIGERHFQWNKMHKANMSTHYR